MEKKIQWVDSNDCLPSVGVDILFRESASTVVYKGRVQKSFGVSPYGREEDSNNIYYKYYWAYESVDTYLLPSLWKTNFRNTIIGISVHCTNMEEDTSVRRNMTVLGFKWKSGIKFNAISLYGKFKENTCYYFHTGEAMSFKDAEEAGHIILPASWFIELTNNIIAQRLYFLDIAIDCNSEEEAKQLTLYAHNLGFKWSSGLSYAKFTLWNPERKLTCYDIVHGIYSSTSNFPKVVSFAEFKRTAEIKSRLANDKLNFK